MKRQRLVLFMLAAVSLSLSAFSQTDDETRLTLDRIFKNREFVSEFFGPARWLSDGATYTTVEASDAVKGARDILKYDTETGKREVLVSAAKLIPPGESTPLRIDDYSWSPDGKLLLLYTSSKRVWRQNTRGDYWVVDLATWKLLKLGGDAKPSTLMFAKFSPDDKRVAYVREHNIYVEDLSSGQIRQLTFDGSKMIINGTFDWVYEEEWFDRDGFRWSPDGASIAYESCVRRLPFLLRSLHR